MYIKKSKGGFEISKKLIETYFKGNYYHYLKLLSVKQNNNKKKTESYGFYNKEIIKKFNIITINSKNNNVFIPMGLFYYDFLPLFLYILYENNKNLDNIDFIDIDNKTNDKINFSFNEDFKFENFQEEMINFNNNTEQAKISFGYFYNKINNINNINNNNNNNLKTLGKEDTVLYNINIDIKLLVKAYNYFKNTAKLSFFYGKVKTGFNIAPARSGKTIIILGMIQKIQKRSLIIVNKDIIPQQFINGITKFTNLSQKDIILYKGQKSLNKIGKIGIAMIKTIKKSIERAKKGSLEDKKFIKEILQQYDVVFFDESHNVATNTYIETLKEINANYIYGFTATKTRSDGNQFLLDYYIGQDIYKIDYNNVKNRVMKIKIFPVFIEHKNPIGYAEFKSSGIGNRLIDKPNWIEGDNKLSELNFRNKKILNLISKAIQEDRTIIVLTKRIKHGLYLTSELNRKYGYNISYFINSKDTIPPEYNIAKKQLNKTIKQKFDIDNVKEIRNDINKIKEQLIKENKLSYKEIVKITAKKRKEMLEKNKRMKTIFKEKELQKISKKYIITRKDIFKKFNDCGKNILEGKDCKGPKVLIATYSLLKEAFDGPYFDTLFLTMPISASKKQVNKSEIYDSTSQLIQSINRIGNLVEGKKQPIVIDFVDIENYKENIENQMIKTNYLFFMFLGRYKNVYTQQDNIIINNIDFNELKNKYNI